MKLGFTLPQLGPETGAEAVGRFAQEAENTGYESLWVLDRLLYPAAPKAPYPASMDGSLPDAYKRTLSALPLLAFAAAHTKKAMLGTSVMVLPLYNPVILARDLSTVDILSGGRLIVGLGTGWSPDEYQAAGVPMNERGARANEALELIRALWSESTPEHSGKHFQLPKIHQQLHPVQQPRPPIYMAAYAPNTMKRVAEKCDGWMPAGVPVGGMKEMWAGIRQMAEAAGRDPKELKLIVRANITQLPEKLGDDRPAFAGSVDQIKADIEGCKELGADQLFFDPQFSPDVKTLEDQRRKLDELMKLAVA